MALAACVLRATTKKGRQLFPEKVYLGDLAGGLSDLEMTWLLYCAGAATVTHVQMKVGQTARQHNTRSLLKA